MQETTVRPPNETTMSRVSLSKAQEIASRFVARRGTLARGTPWQLEKVTSLSVGNCSGILWWDDRTPLYEFVLYQQPAAHRAGM
jgi:hypothetical protein